MGWFPTENKDIAWSFVELCVVIAPIHTSPDVIEVSLDGEVAPAMARILFMYRAIKIDS